jgi:hypothetical protein
MNLTWQNFITSHPISTMPDNNALYPVSYLSILKVSGNDAAQFLQGQLTCNVKELAENNSFFAGFCNAKGRVITTLLILKQADVFLLILPSVLLDKVKNKLQMYVLRSKVQLENVSDDYGLTGMTCTPEIAGTLVLPEIIFARHNAYLKLSPTHYLLINEVSESIKRWAELVNQGFQVRNSNLGEYLDLNTGLAWLDTANSEEYIPQMLNLDKLGGISFTKGCYTGQEVVARTHYLGQVKRELFLAECAADVVFTAETKVLDETVQEVGQILSFQQSDEVCKILVVMQTSAAEATQLRLNNAKQDKISIISFTTA